MAKRRKTQEEQQRYQAQQDADYIPLPIQTFLWRQISPFVRPVLGQTNLGELASHKARELAQSEQHDACKLFERIIITNNIWGQSPSLTDAISSIDRWRLIKVSFPFVLQCTVSLLNRKLISSSQKGAGTGASNNNNITASNSTTNNNKEQIRFGRNEAKMMYTLQWILMNASEECADSEIEAKANANNVVIAAANAASLLKPSNAPSSTTPSPAGQVAGCSSSMSANLDQQRQQQQQLHQTISSSAANPSSQAQPTYSARAGSNSSCINQSSIIIPAANAAAASVAAVAAPSSAMVSHLQMQTTLPSSSSVSPIGSSTPTKPLTPTNPAASVVSSQIPYLLPISSIQMFIYYFAPMMDELKHSDFLTSNQRLEIGAALWEPLFNHQLPNIQCLIAQVKRPSQTQELTSTSFFSYDKQSPICPTLVRPPYDYQLQSSCGTNRRRSSSMLQDQAQFGDVFLGGPSLPAVIASKQHQSAAFTEASQLASSGKVQQPEHQQHPHNQRKNATTNYSSLASQPAEFEQMPYVEVNYATYLDVAVLRCLFIVDWQESGVHWAITFIANRMAELRYMNSESETKTTMRPKSKSLSHIDHCILNFTSPSDNDGPTMVNAISKKATINNSLGSTKHEQALVQSPALLVHDRNSKIFKELHLRQANIDELNSDNKKTSKLNEKQSSVDGKYLKVEDLNANSTTMDTSDANTKTRRLSFSSGMHNLANQIRRTSKRVKKSADNQYMVDSLTSESQLSINNSSSMDVNKQLPSGSLSRTRRSSSADDLSSSQLSNLSMLQKELKVSHDTGCKDKFFTESNPIIQVTTNTQECADKLGESSRLRTKKLPLSYKIQSDTSKFNTNKSEDHQNLLMHQAYTNSMKRLDRLTRSQTVPKDLYYSPYETRKDHSDRPEALGADLYVDDYGRIDLMVILKVLHSISQREAVCSQRVCDNILSLVIALINNGILNEGFHVSRKASQQKDLTNLLPTRQHEFTLLNNASLILEVDSEQNLNKQQQIEESYRRAILIHRILIDIVIRLFHHTGCPHHCGMESTLDSHHHASQQRGTAKFSTSSRARIEASSRNLRTRLKETLDLLCNHEKQNFVGYIQSIIGDRILQQVIDILHSLLGFCHKTDTSTGVGHEKTVSTVPVHHNQSVQFVTTSNNSNSNLAEVLTPNIGQRSGGFGGSSSSPLSDISGSEFDTSRLQHLPISNKFFNQTNLTNHSANQNKKSNSENVESVIVTSSFKQLITRITSFSKELKLQENTALYCDIRRLIDFIRYNHTSVFRTIVLSAMIDCAKMLNQQQELTNNCDTSVQKRPCDLTQPPSDDELSGQNGASYRKGRDLERGTENGLDSEGSRLVESNMIGQSPSMTAQQSPGSQNNDSSPSIKQRSSHGSYRFQPAGNYKQGKQLTPTQPLNQQAQHQSTGILSLSSKAKKKLEQVFGGKPIGKTRIKSPNPSENLVNQQSFTNINDGDHTISYIGDEASRRTSVAGHQSMGSFNDTNYRQFANNNFPSPLAYQLTNIQMIRQNQLLYSAARTGMTNFSFLMESCSPGDLIEAPMLAALLDLKGPIAIRAAIFLECANFVNRCNRGQWPLWMRINVPLHRASNAGVMQSSGGSKFRKSSSIQRTVRNDTQMYRAAGRAFYLWAEAVGARLEELLLLDQEVGKGEAILEDTENDDVLLSEQGTMTSLTNDNQSPSDVDFFRSALDSNYSPFPLKMAACQLLYEVTTFLRETYRYLPPSLVHQQASSSRLGDKMASIYDVSRAVTANRRWSMALSSLGFGQLPATLNAISSSTVNQSNMSSSSNQLRNPTTNTISEHPERRISFILHETNDENEQEQQLEQTPLTTEGSSYNLQNATVSTMNTVEQQQDTMRKLASGRHLSQSTASSAVVVAAATCLLRSSGVIDNQTHRRKSIKLKKVSQERDKCDKKTKFAQDFDEEVESSSLSEVGIRRTDSLRSRRRVSGISEKSDTSERAMNGAQVANTGSTTDGQAIAAAEMSGDESAENASCDDGYGVNDSTEADESKIMSNMPWFKAIALLNSSIDCNCTHFLSCKPNCYKLLQNTCKKLISAVNSIYIDTDGEQDIYVKESLENRLTTLIKQQHDGKTASGNVARSGSDCSNSLRGHGDIENRRKEKKSKRNQQLDSPYDELSHLSPKIKKNLEKSGHKLYSIIQGDSNATGNVYPNATYSTLKTIPKLQKRQNHDQKTKEDLPIIKYIKSNVKSLLHCPMSLFLKGAVILQRETFSDMVKFSWNLLLEDDQQLSRTAAVGFIISSIKCPGEASKILLDELESKDASRKIAAINKFYVIWDARYQCWPRLEDGAFVHFKMAPPSIEFTLPSPKIAQESKPVVDPPWMPRKTSNVEEVTIGQDQTVQKSFVTATKTRRKQQIEILTRALREKYDKLRDDRENYHITSVPITLYAAYEPALGTQSSGGDELDGGVGTEDDNQQDNRALLQMKSAQALFPTCLCQAAIVMINLLDDSRVTYEGSAVYEISSKVIWSCLVEDPSLFLRHFFERLTRQSHSTIFQVLRRLIRFIPILPPQAAYTLYNYLIGFIIYYIRCPVDYSQKLISDTLSVLCLVVPSVYGLFLKDLKQILRKEQCDHKLLITANVPSAKKIIVHGSDSSGIPSQFPIDENTQFYHILVDSLEFFGIDKEKQNEYFLIDVRTNHMHSLNAYVRDYYSFKRSQHPQLQMINMNPEKAFEILQKQELVNQFLEFGKVSMSLSIVRSPHMAVQRVLFLHEELMKLPTFPRKALETNFCLFQGPIGHQVFSMDRVHKICWVRLIARMFELTSGFFLQLGDIHLFLNAISGVFVLHCEEFSVSRLCLASFINAAYQFKNIFAIDGFMPIMATIVQVYSNHQNNQLLCRSIEFVCKQFYILHRKPFLLQLFGSIAPKLNTAEIIRDNQANYPLAANQQSGFPGNTSTNFVLNDPNRISPVAFFRLLQSLEKAFKDPLDILELVDAEKPLRAIDFCYQQDKEAIEILDIISLCVTVTAYASDSPRSAQMLIILEAVVPLYMKHLQSCTSKKAGQSMGKQAHKDELQRIQSISTCIKTLIINCEGLTRNFSGPLPAIDLRSSSIRRTGPSGTKSSTNQHKNQIDSAGSPVDLYYDEISYSGTGDKGKRETNSTHTSGKNTIVSGIYKNSKRLSHDESEITRAEFIVPRDTLLNLVAEFLSLSTGRLMESAKKYVELNQKHTSHELLDVKSHLRLAEIANSLLKFASTDPTVMACRGLTRYMNEILPNTEWRQEAIRPALIMILKRLDKTFNRISKKTWVKKSTDWEGAKLLLKGAYLTFVKHPYIVHLPHLKSLMNCCQNIILSDGLQVSTQASTTNLFHGFSPSPTVQPGIAASQSATVIPQQNSDRQTGNLLNVYSNHYAPGASLSPSGSSAIHAASAPATAHSNQNQQAPSFAAVTKVAALAERLTSASSNNNATISQGFNSVTIRLIAMQLLQSGDSQTLESFVGNSLSTPEKLESLMLNLIYPMCIRVCSRVREAPKLRMCDIMFTLNIVLNMLAPQSSSSKSCSSASSSPKAVTDTSQFILSKITTTIGSTQTGATALGIVGSTAHSAVNTHPIAQHQDSLKIGFLGLKILCVCFEAQLSGEWIRISRVIRDLALQPGQPSGSLWDFLDFVATYRFPIFILLLPMIKGHLAQKVKNESSGENNAHLLQCQRLIEVKVQGVSPTVCRSKSFLFVSITAELRMLKEQLIAKRSLLIEGERQTTSHMGQQFQVGSVGFGNQGSNFSNQTGESAQEEHFTAYHRLSAAIASFTNQGTQAKTSPAQQLGTSTALKGACFAAQLATSNPIGPQISDGINSDARHTSDMRQESSQSSIRLSTARSREEARKVMNNILRRTSYPHNQLLLTPEQHISERKNSQPPSPSSINRYSTADIELGKSNQIIMDPAMLMAAFPAPRKSTAGGSGILKQLIQTIDKQNQNQRQQQYQSTSKSENSPTMEHFNIKNCPESEPKTSSEPKACERPASISHRHESTGSKDAKKIVIID